MIIKEIDKKLKEIYKKQKNNKKDKTGFDFVQALKKEANYNPFLFYFLVYRTFELALENNEVINLPYMVKELLRSPYHYENLVDVEDTSPKETIEIPGFIFEKGVATKVLEKLKLEETKKAFLYHLLIKQKEINPEAYLSKEQISKLYNIESVIQIYLKEYQKKKLKNKSKFIKIRK